MNGDDAEPRYSARERDARGALAAEPRGRPAALTRAAAGGFIGAYCALLFAGYALQANPSAVTTVWPADGLLFSTLSLLRRRDWPWVILAGFAVDILVNRLTPGTFHLDSAIWYAVTHTLDGAIGATLARRWIHGWHSQRDAVKFYLAGAIGCACSTTVGISVYLSNHPESSAFAEWWRWWAGTFLGIVTFAPIVFMWVAHWRDPKGTRAAKPWWRLALTNALLIAVTAWIFGGAGVVSRSSLSFAVFPLLVLVALLSPSRWTTLSSSAVVLLAAVMTNRGFGPFAGTASLLAGTLSLQIFLALAAAMAFMISLAADDQRATAGKLQASEGRLRTIIDTEPDCVKVVRQDGTLLEMNAAGVAMLEANSVEEARAHGLANFICPDHQASFAALHRRVIEGERGELDFEVIGLRGTRRWLHTSAAPMFDVTLGETVLVGITTDISERKRAVEQLRTLNEELGKRVLARTSELKEREVMLQEIHHRVKNNLQVVASLINMQRRARVSASTRAALQQCRSRVETMAQIHEMLYQSKDYARVPFARYARDLASRVLSASGGASTSISLDFALEDLALPVDKAIPCGLILNELVANSIKHAFPDAAQGRIRIELRRLEQGAILLSVSDDGIGIAPQFVPETAASLGIQLVVTLVEQLDGRLEIVRQPGATFRVTFPVEP